MDMKVQGSRSGKALSIQSHDFTMATHYEHAYYYDKNGVSDTSFSLSAIHTHHCVAVEITQNSVSWTCALQTLMEWIYTQTKMSDQDSVELALIMKKKQRKNAVAIDSAAGRPLPKL